MTIYIYTNPKTITPYSGHLARHNRIHTGEKNFPCLFPGCQSRFSRQDNMMQHYRTHMSPKSRRSQKRGGGSQAAEEVRPRPRLHAHHRIKSDPIRVEPPLTIDQHLSNYHQSLRASPLSQSTTLGETEQHHYSPVRFNFPLPLSSTARSPSTLKRVGGPLIPINIQRQQQQQEKEQQQEYTSTPSPTLSHSSSTTSLPSIHHMIDDTNNTTCNNSNNNNTSRPISPDSRSYNQHQHSHSHIGNMMEREVSNIPPPPPPPSSSISTPIAPITAAINTSTTTITTTTTTNSSSPNLSPSTSSSTLFYQHRPLTFTRPQQQSSSSFPYTLLHPAAQQQQPQGEDKKKGNVTPNQSSSDKDEEEKDDPMDEDDKDEDRSPSSGGLLQLAHIVSTFG